MFAIIFTKMFNLICEKLYNLYVSNLPVFEYNLFLKFKYQFLIDLFKIKKKRTTQK